VNQHVHVVTDHFPDLSIESSLRVAGCKYLRQSGNRPTVAEMQTLIKDDQPDP
jgi:hypothetical protein